MSVPPPAAAPPYGAIPLGGGAARAVAAVRLLDPDDGDLLAGFRMRLVGKLEDPDHYRLAVEAGSFVAYRRPRAGRRHLPQDGAGRLWRAGPVDGREAR
jgi:hypothetical protein